ncbi:MAG TPA: mechanosensitive ion channel family protein [Acidimicrobiales bacterium]|nr:mechanosensitive ion channel family protein [Acidimicrobiales bacterium]
MQTADEVEQACGTDPSWACQRVLDLTESEAWAEATDLLNVPLRILVIFVLAWVANRLVRRAIHRFTDGIGNPEAQERIRRLKRRAPAAVVPAGSLSLRSAARARTLAQVLQSIATIGIWTIALVMMLGELGVNLGPLIAGAGIAGVAIGFGAQSLVKDFLSGIFMLAEDQYGVGDIIDAGEASGTVEEVSLRTTRLRDVNGTVWHIPNGMIERVGNKSQQWARALLDVGIAYGADIDEAQSVIKQVADGLWREPEWSGKILDEPEVWGIEQLGPDAIVIRLVVKTQPSEQFAVTRELRRRLADAFYHEGIELPFPQRSVWVRRDRGSSVEQPEDLIDIDGDGDVDYRLAPVHENSSGEVPPDEDEEPETAPVHETPRPDPPVRAKRR